MTETPDEHDFRLDTREVERLVSEAESEYDLSSCDWEVNPHFNFLHLAPDDLADAINRRAEMDNVSGEEIVRRALENYLQAG